MSARGFVDSYWKPYLDRKNVKLSTRASYQSALGLHILPALGELRIREIVPLHIENLIQAKLASGLRSKTVSNILVLMQGIFSVAEDNDLISRSPVRNKHKPNVQKREKPIWTSKQVRMIIETVPFAYRALFAVAALTGARLGEILGLQWKQIDLSKKMLRIEQSLWQGQIVPRRPRKRPDGLFW
jgi:integrase